MDGVAHSEVVPEELVTSVQLPRPDDVERVVVEQGDPARAVVLGAAQREQEDPAGPAVDGVRP
jgi:hypothetical protein